MILPDSVWAALQKPGWNQIKYILSAISRLYGLTETENKHTHSWQKKNWWLPVATIQSHFRRSEKSWNLYSGVHVVHQMTLTYFSDFRHSNTLKQIYSTVVIPASKIVSCYSLYAWIVFYSSWKASKLRAHIQAAMAEYRKFKVQPVNQSVSLQCTSKEQICPLEVVYVSLKLNRCCPSRIVSNDDFMSILYMCSEMIIPLNVNILLS